MLGISGAHRFTGVRRQRKIRLFSIDNNLLFWYTLMQKMRTILMNEEKAH